MAIPSGPGDFVIPDVLPVLPLREAIVFPLTAVPLAVGQPRSLRLVDDVMRANRLLALSAQREPNVEPAAIEDLHRIGTVGSILQLGRAPDGSVRLMVQGIERIRLLDRVANEAYLVARIEVARDRTEQTTEVDALRSAVVDIFRRLVEVSPDLPDELAATVASVSDPRHVAYLVASVVPVDFATRQKFLEIDPVAAKLRRLVDVLQRELAVRELGRKITSDTEERLSKNQREFYLREQLRSIQRELGESEGADGQGAELRRRIEEAALPDEARREAERELGRVATIPSSLPEHGMVVTYLEWMASLPWSKLGGGTIDVRLARRVLDEDHFDLDKIKDRILEYLAVQKLRQERKGQLDAGVARTPAEAPRAPDDAPPREPILCFVGPPGVGKTSLGKSIARATGRKFVRLSLGGVRDEAEIRGHRRTYIGALPGQIIQMMKKAGTVNPVLLLDEVDKLGTDFRGDPSAALLEVLDPEQNHMFQDHYLDVEYDLSKVFFIATANVMHTIPPALQDRLEVLRLSGYTEREKLEIAKRHLIPKQAESNGLRMEQFEFTDEGILEIIRHYTRESGVRNLEREIGSCCRKIARKFVGENVQESFKDEITAERVQQMLGPIKFRQQGVAAESEIGLATGLAWTEVGGEVLQIEATLVKGRGAVTLTGKLGDVMQESAQAALTCIKARAERLGMSLDFIRKRDLHIHIPEGAIPKDGPSAGITMAAAMASALMRVPIRKNVAMTGEITLRGRVLPIGGVKEKLLAAHRFGIDTIILPKDNEKDLPEVPEEVRSVMDINLVETIDEVIALALEEQTPPAEIADESKAPPLWTTEPPPGLQAPAEQ